MGRDLVGSVTARGALALVPLAGAAAYVAGLPGFLGVLAGGAVALWDFRWLSAASHRAVALVRDGRVHPLWLLGLGLRHLSVFAAVGAVLWSGYVHPLALVVGLSALPPVLIVQALRAAPDR
jgi:hypothetical protein